MTWPFDAASPVPLPPGRPATADEGEAAHPLLWIGDGPASAGTLTAYAEQLVDSHRWTFWWVGLTTTSRQ